MKIYVALGVDCDPDRDRLPSLCFKGVESLHKLFSIENVRWTLNYRLDKEVNVCSTEIKTPFYPKTEIACHIHYCKPDGSQDFSDKNIDETIKMGVFSYDTVHVGWCYNSQHSEALNDYSPLPGCRISQNCDWIGWGLRHQNRYGKRMIPTYTAPFTWFYRRILGKQSGNRFMLHPTVSPLLYRPFIRSWFKSGLDYFVTYFHADELISALPDYRKHLYSFKNLKSNIKYFKSMAKKYGHDIEWVTIRELGEVLWK